MNFAKANYASWLPVPPNKLRKWIQHRIEELEDQDKNPELWHDVIQEFQRLIDDNSKIYMGFGRMFDHPPKGSDPKVKDVKTMLSLYNSFLGKAPPFGPEYVVVLQFTAVLQEYMATQTGLTVLMDPLVNEQFKKIFNVWSDYLGSPASTNVLTTDTNGWLGSEAMKKMPNFIETFQCDPNDPDGHWGFKCWNDFFARKLKPNARPVKVDNDPNVITSGCESQVYRISSGVKERDQYWLKGQPYSIYHMLNGNYVGEFIAGTVYQAFLSPYNFHRWTSPVDGKIEKIDQVAGTYYAALPMDPEQDGKMDSSNPWIDHFARSQGFITATATRCLIFIRATNPSIGLMCFIPVGMTEVSTCELSVKEGDAVKKGQELGTFQYGGSTHCMVFRKETPLRFTVKEEDSVEVNSAVATVLGDPCVQTKI